MDSDLAGVPILNMLDGSGSGSYRLYPSCHMRKIRIVQVVRRASFQQDRGPGGHHSGSLYGSYRLYRVREDDRVLKIRV